MMFCETDQAHLGVLHSEGVLDGCISKKIPTVQSIKSIFSERTFMLFCELMASSTHWKY